VKAAAVNIHYLSTGLDVEVVLPALPSHGSGKGDAEGLERVDLAALKRRLGARKLEVLREVSTPSTQSGSSTQAGATGHGRRRTTVPHGTN